MSTKPVPVLNRNAHISMSNFYNFDMEIRNLEFLSRNTKEFDFDFLWRLCVIKING